VRPTASEIQAQEARAQEKKSEQDERNREERRKNLALLNTYSSEKDIEEARKRAHSRKPRPPSRPQNGPSPGRKKRQKELGLRKGVLRQEAAAVQAQAGNQQHRDRDQEPETRLLAAKKREKSASSTPSTTRTSAATSS